MKLLRVEVVERASVIATRTYLESEDMEMRQYIKSMENKGSSCRVWEEVII